MFLYGASTYLDQNMPQYNVLLHCPSISVSKGTLFSLSPLCQPCIAVIKYNIHGSPKTPNIKMFIIEVSNRSEKKFADMDLRQAVVLLVAVVYLSTAAGMNCLNSFFSSSMVLLDSSY